MLTAARVLLSSFGIVVVYALLEDVFLVKKSEDMSICRDTLRQELLSDVWDRKSLEFKQLRKEIEYTLSATNFSAIDEKNAFDLFEPEWHCEDERRFGGDLFSFGDGPKFVCGRKVLQKSDDCVVYSIGSYYDFQFEYAVNHLAPHCEIHTFDGTMDITSTPLPEGLERKNIFFHNWNLGPECGKSEGTPQTKCFEEILTLLGHRGKTISWLKIDCEGCEFDVLPNILQSQVKLDQLLIEVHGTDADMIAKLFRTFTDAGLMIFHKERNHWGCLGYLCVEYSLLSSEYAKQVLDSFLIPGV